MANEALDDAGVIIPDGEGEPIIPDNNGEQENTIDPVEVENLRKAKSQLTARAKKAEDDLREFKKTHPETPINNNPQLSDELKLIARGLSDEEIEQAKVIAKGKGIVLTEAIKDPLFLVYQSDLKEKERKEKAKLGASKGSGESQDDTLIKPEMTREEHEKAFKKVMGN